MSLYTGTVYNIRRPALSILHWFGQRAFYYTSEATFPKPKQHQASSLLSQIIPREMEGSRVKGQGHRNVTAFHDISINLEKEKKVKGQTSNNKVLSHV